MGEGFLLAQGRTKSARRSVSRVLSRPNGRGWPFIWDARRRTPHATDPSGGARGPPGGPGRNRSACRSYLVLLPVGFALPPPLPATRCALTAPFHPCRPCRPKRGQGSAVCFCGTFPRVAPAGRYPAPCLRGARTFLPTPSELDEERPSDRLAWDDMGCASIAANRAGESRARRPRSNSAPDRDNNALTADLLLIRRKTGAWIGRLRLHVIRCAHGSAPNHAAIVRIGRFFRC